MAKVTSTQSPMPEQHIAKGHCISYYSLIDSTKEPDSAIIVMFLEGNSPVLTIAIFLSASREVQGFIISRDPSTKTGRIKCNAAVG
ncbi:hypothetical protein [Kluyvera sichuanensis]|uniref:hypothetical protein n=1 Tax=Kluyvera sichuanensis TaxID=2725494 RepID=UPI0034A26938